MPLRVAKYNSVCYRVKQVVNALGGHALQRLTVSDAARELNISVQAIHGRINRGTIEYEKEDGRLYVFLPDETEGNQPQGNNVVNEVFNSYITSLKSEIESLKKDREARIEEARRKDAIIMSLTQRIPELEAPIEPPSEPSESSVTDSDTESRGVVPPDSHNRSWWRRIFTS
jgi:hypothetical protein